MEYTTLDKISENLDSKRKPITSSDRVEGEIPYYGASGIVDYVKDYIFDESLLLVSEDGANLLARSTPIAFSVTGKTWINNHAHVLRFSNENLQKFVEIYLNSISLESYVTGSAQPKLNQKMLNGIPIPVVDDSQIEIIVNSVENLKSIIELRKQELACLDELIKARFVEMFGDPVSNPYGYNKVALSDLADIKIGPFGSLLHKEDYIEGGHPLLNPSHIVEGKVSPDDKLTISDEKYEELLAYQLKAGDVVLGRRGEMGRCAVVSKEGFLCGTGSILIRTKGEVTGDYIQKIISFPSFKKTIEDMAVGQTMPNLNVPIVASFQIIKPPVEVQNSYHAFVEQVDKSKVVEGIRNEGKVRKEN